MLPTECLECRSNKVQVHATAPSQTCTSPLPYRPPASHPSKLSPSPHSRPPVRPACKPSLARRQRRASRLPLPARVEAGCSRMKKKKEEKKINVCNKNYSRRFPSQSDVLCPMYLPYMPNVCTEKSRTPSPVPMRIPRFHPISPKRPVPKPNALPPKKQVYHLDSS